MATANARLRGQIVAASWAHGRLTPAAQALASQYRAQQHATRLASHVVAPLVTLSARQAITVGGKLTDRTDNSPISGAALYVWQTVNGQLTLLGSVQTDGQGSWHYKLPAGPSRTIDVTWSGSATVRGVTDALRESYPATVRLSAVLHANGNLTFSGRVLGGYIPATGLFITIQWAEPGKNGSWPFATTRANPNGRFQVTKPTVRSGRTYRFWAIVSREAGWPYRGGTSAAVRIRLR